MAYKIILKPSAEKQFARLDKITQKQILAALCKLAEAPRSPNTKKLADSDFFRMRTGNYRIIYHIEDQTLIVCIVKIGHRSEVYR